MVAAAGRSLSHADPGVPWELCPPDHAHPHLNLELRVGPRVRSRSQALTANYDVYNPPYMQHNTSRAKDGFGDVVFLYKYRILSRNEKTDKLYAECPTSPPASRPSDHSNEQS